jgi:hypothetical protein
MYNGWSLNPPIVVGIPSVNWFTTSSSSSMSSRCFSDPDHEICIQYRTRVVHQLIWMSHCIDNLSPPLSAAPATRLYFETFTLYCFTYCRVTSHIYPSSSTASTYTIQLSTTAGHDKLPTGVGSKTLCLFTVAHIGSTGSQQQSGRKITSVQKTGGVVHESERPGQTTVKSVNKLCKK